MNRLTTVVFSGLILFLSAYSVQAGTIIKLGFGTDSLPDIQLIDGKLSTFDDGAGATDGDQNTEVTFLGALAGITPPVGDRASFSLGDISLAGEPTVIGGTVLQPTTGGTFDLYDASNTLLLAGNLGNGTLSGPVSNIATGGFLTTEFGDFTGGSLLPSLRSEGVVNSSFSIALTDVNGGKGLTIDSETNELKNFTADATANIGGQTPEPSSLVLCLLGSLAILPCLRKRR